MAKKKSSHLKELYLLGEGAPSLCAIINSSLFYWWFVVLANGRDLNRREIFNFKFDLAVFHQKYGEQISQLVQNLMENFKQKFRA